MVEASPIVVIGIGNDFRSDDAVGLYVARKIDETGFENVYAVAGISDGTSLLEHWHTAKAAFIVDCVISGAKPGDIIRFDAIKEIIPTKLFSGYSTHAFNVAEAINLAKSLEQLPPRLIVYGIEGSNFSFGSVISAEVKEAASKVIDSIVKEIREMSG